MTTLPLFGGAPLSRARGSLLLAPLAVVGLAALGACSGSSATSTGGSTSSSSHSGSGATTSSSSSGPSTSSSGAGGAGGGMVCPPSMKYGGGEMKVVGGSVTAKIVDETGAPVVGQPLYICGIDICSNPGMTQSGGSASISTTLMMKKPAFKFGDALSYAEVAVPLTMASTDFTMGGTMVLATGKLSDKPGADLTPGMGAVSGDVTVAVPTGATVGINPLTYSTPDQQKFRSVGIPIANAGPVLDPVMASSGPADFKLFYGVAPAETTLCPAAKVTVALPHAQMMPNDLGWAPGAAVEFWIMTTDTTQTYAPYGGWAKMSDGAVSSDGKSVATSDGQGFVLLENFAIRLKQ